MIPSSVKSQEHRRCSFSLARFCLLAWDFTASLSLVCIGVRPDQKLQSQVKQSRVLVNGNPRRGVLTLAQRIKSKLQRGLHAGVLTTRSHTFTQGLERWRRGRAR